MLRHYYPLMTFHYYYQWSDLILMATKGTREYNENEMKFYNQNGHYSLSSCLCMMMLMIVLIIKECILHWNISLISHSFHEFAPLQCKLRRNFIRNSLPNLSSIQYEMPFAVFNQKSPTCSRTRTEGQCLLALHSPCTQSPCACIYYDFYDSQWQELLATERMGWERVWKGREAVEGGMVWMLPAKSRICKDIPDIRSPDASNAGDDK